MTTYTAPDGVIWGITVQSPGASNAILYFRHPDGQSSRLDRYNWILNQGPEARSVTARVVPAEVLDRLDAAQVARLFARSMPVSSASGLAGAPSAARG